MIRLVTSSIRLRLLASAAASLSLAACSETSDSFHGKHISMAGAGVVLDKPFEPYDEVRLSNLIATSVPGGLPDPSGNLETTVGHFGTALYSTEGSTRQNQMRDARNQVQGMLLAASANRCNAFKLILRERSSNTNFVLGSLAVALGAAGAVVTGGASQALAGAAGAASGINAEYTKDILSSVTTSVIIPGIDKQRSAILQEITNRRCLGLSSYNLTQAMTDAIRYHAACSTDVGVAAAGSALSQTNKDSSPSMTEASNTMAAVFAMRDKLAKGMAAGGGTSGAAASPAPAAAAPGAAGGVSASSGAASTGTGSKPTLVGDQINYLQCPSLQADGTLSGFGAPSATMTPAASAGIMAGDQVQYGER